MSCRSSINLPCVLSAQAPRFDGLEKNGLLERMLPAHSALFISPYRCKSCDKRYFRLRLPVHTAEKPPRHAE